MKNMIAASRHFYGVAYLQITQRGKSLIIYIFFIFSASSVVASNIVVNSCCNQIVVIISFIIEGELSAASHLIPHPIIYNFPRSCGLKISCSTNNHSQLAPKRHQAGPLHHERRQESFGSTSKCVTSPPSPTKSSVGATKTATAEISKSGITSLR